MERAEPRHALDGAADKAADALFHLACRFIGEGDGENLRGPRLRLRQNVSDARGEHPCFAGSGAGEHEQRPLRLFHRHPLFQIEPIEIGRRARRSHGPGRDRSLRWRSRGFGAFALRCVLGAGSRARRLGKVERQILERFRGRRAAGCRRAFATLGHDREVAHGAGAYNPMRVQCGA